MAKERDLVVHVAIYESIDLAKADLDAIEQLHKDDLIGTFDAAVVDKENGKPNIVKRMARPMVQVIPDVMGDDFDALLPYDELHGVASQLSSSEAGLIVVGEPTLDKAFDRVLAKFVAEGVEPGALERAKTRLIADALYARDSQSDLARWYGSSLAIGQTMREVEEWPAEIEAVGAEAVLAAARRFLDRKPAVTGHLLPLEAEAA